MTRFADRYELGGILGSGGFATVYRARDRAENRDVAIKVISEAGGSSPDLVDRFRHEALALSRLSSPHVARVFDFGKDDIGLYLVMELILGVPLDAVGLGRALTEREVLVAAKSLLSALSEAHSHGLVHRDIKPANILVPRGIAGLDALKVLDFGIARAERRSEILLALGSSETQQGHVVGTPAYMAPEQVTLDEVGPAADVWSAGLVLFELLDRGPLFPGGSEREQLVARISTDANIEDRVQEPLRSLFHKMLARDPSHRFANASDALLAVAGAHPATSRSALPQSETAYARTELKSVAPPSRRSLGPPRRPELVRQLARLDKDPMVAFKQTFFALDLAMINALARRERGSAIGQITSALSLALRIELEAAAVVLEPLLATNPLARALSATVVIARSNLSIAKRLDADPADTWISEIDPSLACMLAGVSTALSGPERAVRNLAMATKAYERARGSHEGEIARVAARVAAGVSGSAPIDEALADVLLSYEESKPRCPADEFSRSLSIGNLAFRADELVAREHLERATRVAAETAAALFEARALVSLGAVMLSARLEIGLVGLERASTLLAHGEATSLEQMATHNTGAALMIARRYREAIPYLQRAIALAREESRVEYDALAGASLAFACLTQNDESELEAAMHELASVDETAVSPRARSFIHTVQALRALRNIDAIRASREARTACDWGEKAGLSGTDAWLIAQVFDLTLAVARGENVDVLGRSADLEHTSRERGFASFFWFDVMIKSFEQIPDAGLREALLDPMKRVAMLLGPQS